MCTFFLLPTLIPIVLFCIGISWHNFGQNLDIMMPESEDQHMVLSRKNSKVPAGAF